MRRFSDGVNPPFRKGRSLASFLALVLSVLFITSSVLPLLTAPSVAASSTPADDNQPSIIAEGVGDDLVPGSRSSNLTVTSWTSHYKVLTEEYSIVVDYSTSFIEYQIKPYFTTDFIRYKRANPYYSGDGTVDQNGNALDSVSMTVSNWGRDGYVVWFLESCPEFSIKQSFNIYRDYFELNVTYTPGTKNVRTTYYIGLVSSSNSLYNIMSNGIHRYIPGFPEDTPSSYGLGGWYPSYQMYAPVCDLRVPSRNLGVEWGYEDTVAYLYSPLWLSGGSGGPSIMSFRYTSLNSVIPNVGAGISETFHTFVRPYKYTDGQERGYDVGYAQWVAPRIASAWGNLNTPTFPLTVMNTGSWTTSFRNWVENSQVKVATYSDNSNQIDWNYKSAQLADMNPDTPAYVPTSWQVYSSTGTPLTLSDGSVVCNPVSGPYTQSGTYRWQLINNDDYMDWWKGTSGVFWDEINLWSPSNQPRNDYQIRSDFIYSGYLRLIKESHDSGYWSYIMGNSYSALLHLSIAADLTVVEAYEPSSVFGVTMVKHVQSTMNFVNNIPSTYKPRILVYQTYASSSSNDQEDVYSALFGAAKYNFHVELLCYDSYDGQLHNLRMAEDMFKAMGCTRDSDTRTVTVATLDLSQSSSITTSAGMLVMKGSGTPSITSTNPTSTFKLTNLRSSATQFNLAFTSSYLYQSGTNVQTSSPMTFTTDGKGTYHGTINGEKTGEVVRNSNVQIAQHTSGSTSVSLVSLSTTSAELNLASTGGTTAVTLKGMKASTAFDIFVDGVEVATVTSQSDGTLSFERAYGSSDVLKVVLSDGTPPDTTKPTVQSCSPSNGATGVSVGTQVTVTFSEDMDQDSVESAFSLTRSGVQVSGTFSWSSGRTVTFTPSAALSYSSTYSVQVTTVAKDLAGNVLQAAFGSQFITEVYVNPDTTKPTVQSCSPSNGATGVSIGTQITISFSENMDQDSVESAFSLSAGGVQVSGTFSWGSGSVVTFTPSELDYSTVCSIQLATSASDLAGNGLASVFASQFTTASEPDTTKPTVQSCSPSNGATGVSVGTQVTVTFSEDMDQDSVESAFSLTRSGVQVSGTFSWSSGNKMVFDPASNLDYAATYVIDIGAAATDLAGNALTSAFNSQFTTLTYTPPPPQPGPPSSPLNLRAEGGVRHIALTWEVPSDDGGADVTGYRVYRSSSSLGTYELVATLSAVLQYTDTGLENGATYYYRVSALNSAGEGALSASASAKTFMVPSSPQGLTATPSLGQVRLDWSAPIDDGGTPVTNYRIYRGTASGEESLLAVVDDVLNYTDGSVTNGQVYYYVVAAVSAVGIGTTSNEVATKAGALPSEPQYVLGTSGDKQVLLTWQEPLSNGGLAIIGYNIYRGTSAKDIAFLTSVQELSYLDEGLSNGVTYYYRVSALNTAGEGALSSTAKARPMTVPSAPLYFEAYGGNSEIRLGWSPPADNGGDAIIGYVIYRSGPSEAWSFLTFVEGSLEYLDSGLANGVTMKYLVTAVNRAGEGLASDVAQATTSSLPPSTPRSLTATWGDTSVSLHWQPPVDTGGSPVVGYKVYRGLDGSSMTLIAELGNVLEFTDTGLSNGVEYWYAVSAMNGEGEGVMSTHVATTPMAPPGAPLSFSAIQQGGSATLTWLAPASDNGSAVYGYNLYEQYGSDWILIATLNDSTLEYGLLGLAPGSHHAYQIRALNSVGEGAASVTELDLADLPGAPTILWIREGVRNVSLAWSTPIDDGGSPITSYVIYRAEGAGTFRILAILPASEHELLNEGLNANTTYRYYISAMNAMGTGETSDMALATVLPDPVPGDGRTPTAKNWVAAYQDVLVAGGTLGGLLMLMLFVAFMYFRRLEDEGIPFISYLKTKSREKASTVVSPLIGLLRKARRKE